MGSDDIPLGPEDRAILALEGPTIAGHTCKVVRVGAGAPDPATLRGSIARRLDAAPLLTRRLGGPAGAPAWVADEDFDVARHVCAAPVDGPLGVVALCTEVARLFEQRLDRSHPLWRIDVVPLEAGSALVWRIHHALADGTSSMRYARALLWDPDAAAPSEPGGVPATGSAEAHVAAEADERRRRAHLAGFLHREFARSRTSSPFDGRVGTHRAVAFATAPLHELHDAARQLAGATLNDAVLTIVAGAVRRWVEHHHGRLGEVRVRIPVSLHHEGDDAANRDSFFSVALGLGEADPIARLRSIRAETAVRKADHDAETMDTLLRDLGRVSPRLAHFANRLEDSPRRFAVNVSNVPGPRHPVAVLGAPVRALHSIAEIGERHALRVSITSVAGTLGFGFCADPAILDDVQAMADGVEVEAAILTA